MPDSPEQFAINPKAMFFEDRWVFISRAYGKEFCQKLFYHTIEWYVRAVYAKSAMTSEDKLAKTCEFVASALGEVKSDYQDPNKVHEEIGNTRKTPATAFLQEHNGYVMTSRMKDFAARCATCGPLAAVAGYTMEHFLINKTFGSYPHVKADLGR